MPTQRLAIRSGRVLGVAVAAAALPCAAAHAQLVVGHDSAAGQIAVIDFANPGTPRTLLTGTDAQVQAMAADESGRMLYWLDGGTRLMRAPYTFSGTITPTLVGLTTVGGTTTTFTGLAFDSTERKLYAWRNSGSLGTEGFYEINGTNGQATLVYATATTGFDFGGFDFDAATNAFFACSDSNGAGIYRLSKPLATTTPVLVTPYPSGDSDIDGLAAGGGRIYLVNDNNTGMYVYNLSSAAYEATVPFTYASTGGTFCGGAYAPGLLLPPTGSDLSLVIIDSPDPIILPPGSDITYTVTVRNNGPETASSASFTATLPATTSFVSATAPATFNGTSIVAELGLMAVGQERVFTFVLTPLAPATVSLTGDVSNPTDGNASNNTATVETTIRPPQADLRVSITDPGDCSVGVGGTVLVTATLTNLGTESATDATLTMDLPEGAVFLSSTPALTPDTENRLTLPASDLAVNAQRTLAVQMTALEAGPLAFSASGASPTSDPIASNNTAAEVTRIAGSSPATARAVGLISTIITNESSLVPGLSGVRFSAVGGIARPFKSPTGSRWIVQADTDASSQTDAVLIVGSASGMQVVARENTLPDLPTLPLSNPSPPPYRPFGDFDGQQAINDAGHYAYSGLDSRDGTVDDAYIVKWDGTQHTLIAQESALAPVFGPGARWGGERGGVAMTQNGAVHFVTTLGGSGVSFVNDAAAVGGSGTTVLARKGVTAPGGQNGPAQTFASFSPTFSVSADGAAWGAAANLNGPAATSAVGVVSGDVLLQGASPIPGHPTLGNAGAGNPVASLTVEADGTSMLIAMRTTDGDVVLRNGAIAAIKGGAIVPGSTELWGDSTAFAAFFLACADSQGNWIVGGLTNSADGNADSVIVLNGERVVARENDAVDLNGNGIFDDNAYIRDFVGSRGFLADDGTLVCVVTLRNGDAANCGATDTNLGQALVRISTSQGVVVTCDYNADGGADTADVLALADDIAAGLQSFPPNTPDFNQDGGADTADVLDMANAIASGTCP